MAEIASIKNQTRRVKALVLSKAEDILLNPSDYSKEIYESTYLAILKNTVPRTQEVTGEDGEPIKISFDPTFSGLS